MANTTVYPFGTNGNLPASVGIVNDLVTGGADNALSAEQGKVLAERLDAIGFDVDEDGVYFVDSDFRIGAQITSSGFSAINTLTFETL